MLEKLKSLGYTDQEAKVYLALLKLGKTTSEPLIRKVGLHRQAVYDTLNKLFDKGLATYTFQGRAKSYQAAPPETITQKAKDINETAKSIMPELKKMQSQALQTNVSKIYQGESSFKTVLFDVLEKLSKGDCLNVLGTTDEEFLRVTKYYIDNWHKQREKRGISVRVLRNKKGVKESIKRTKGYKAMEIGITKKEINTTVNTWTYKNNVAIIIWQEEPLIIHIESKAAYKAYTDYFNLLWNKVKK